MTGEGPEVGRDFDERYVIERELARGGMGRVFIAHDKRIGRNVALKVLFSGDHDQEALQRFAQEARAAGSLNHPNVVTVLDAGTHLGQPYIVSELLTGQTLRERLEAGPLPLKTALELALQLARGLAAAHDKGIVHRDLKPENLFIDRDGWLKILDFGIAKLLTPAPLAVEQPASPEAPRIPTPPTAADTLDRGPHTASGRIVGTVGYMAPEQVRGEQVDHRADLFSFGTVLYEMVGGARAFRRASGIETSYAILSSDPPDLPRTLPAPLRALIKKCLEKSPDKRPKQTRDLVRDLEVMLAATPTLPDGLPAMRERRRLRVSLLFALLLLFFALVSLVFALRDQLFHRAHPSPTVAVLPFTIRGSERFAYLGEGMVDLMTTNLSGGAVRVVDPHALLRQAALEKGALDVPRARALASRLSASLLVLGSIVKVERKLHVQAALYEVAGSGGPLAEAKVEGDAGELFRLVDDLTLQLRKKLLPGSVEAEGPSGRLARLAQRMTRSPEALEAYLEGESTLRKGSFKNALTAFQRATALDPEFALAQYRLAVAASIRDPALADASLRRALEHKDRLSARDRSLMEAYVAFREGRSIDAEKQYRSIVATHPEEVEAWYQLGELLFHFSPLVGKPASLAAEPLGRTLILDPLHGGALIHTIDLAQLQGQKQLVLALVDRYLALSDAEPGTKLPMQWTRAWAQGDEGSRAWLLDELRRESATRQDLYRTLIRAEWQGDGALADAGRLAKSFAQHPVKEVRAEGLEESALLELAHGRPHAARALLEQAAAENPEGAFAAEALSINVIDHVPATRVELERDLAAVRAFKGPHLPDEERLRLEGLLSLRLGDTAAVERAAAALEKLEEAGSIGSDSALSLRARLLARAGRPREALATLARMKLIVPYQIASRHSRLLDPLFRAELLAGLGQHAEAAALCDLRSFYSRLEVIYFAPSELCAARAAEKLGLREKAAGHYRAATTLWSETEAALYPAVDEARRKLRELEPPAK